MPLGRADAERILARLPTSLEAAVTVARLPRAEAARAEEVDDGPGRPSEVPNGPDVRYVDCTDDGREEGRTAVSVCGSNGAASFVVSAKTRTTFTPTHEEESAESACAIKH